MMRKSILLITLPLFLFAGTLFAQQPTSVAVDSGLPSGDISLENINAIVLKKIAYINSNDVLESMPEKIKATEKIVDLNNKYKEELAVIQNDYNKKYSDFISYQNTMADNIRLRRMQELHELERHISEFMKLAQSDIESHEQELIIPLRERLKKAIGEAGVENGYICVYDLANPAIAFVTPEATDITVLVKNKLGIK